MADLVTGEKNFDVHLDANRVAKSWSARSSTLASGGCALSMEIADRENRAGR